MPWKKILLEGDAAVLTDTVTPADVDFTPAAIGVSDEAARADHRHKIPDPTVAPVDADFAAASIGTSTEVPRADHKHSISAPTAAPPAVDGSAEAIGTADQPARADHRHALGPLVADLDFAEYEADGLSLETRADLPAVVTTKQGRIGFYTYDQHPYIYTTA